MRELSSSQSPQSKDGLPGRARQSRPRGRSRPGNSHEDLYFPRRKLLSRMTFVIWNWPLDGEYHHSEGPAFWARESKGGSKHLSELPKGNLGSKSTDRKCTSKAKCQNRGCCEREQYSTDEILLRCISYHRAKITLCRHLL